MSKQETGECAFTCELCIWFDQCGATGGSCDDFDPANEEDSDTMRLAEYIEDLIERIDEYEEQLAE